MAAAAAPAIRAARNRILLIAGIAVLGNGAALVAHIVFGLPLGTMVAILWTTAIVTLVLLFAGLDQERRSFVVRTVVVGLVAGFVATVAYDVSKAILAELDPSPYNPFEVARIFGQLLVGVDAPAGLILVAGWGFHFANGCSFAIAYACLFARSGLISRRRGLATGVAWGVFLETFQLALYPGWLSINFLDEFRRISFLAHVVFGASLGLLVPAGLRWLNRRAAPLGGVS